MADLTGSALDSMLSQLKKIRLTPESALSGEKIKLRRKELKLNQAKLASTAGITQPHLSRIERNLDNPSVEVLIKLSEALETSIHDLIA